MLSEEKESTELRVYSATNCTRCGNEYKKKLLVFNNKKDCFICNRTVCSDCLTKEERYEPGSGRKGYACLDCYPKTKIANSSSLLPGVMDINSAVDAIDTRIPEHLKEISSKLDQIENVRTTINEITDAINFHVDDVKKYSETFTRRNWGLIQKDIYRIIIFAGIGIIFISVIITILIMLLIKYLYPLL